MSRYGRELAAVFDLLGRHEPALTAALGWVLGRSPKLMAATLAKLDLDPRADPADVAVHLETADAQGRTDIELIAPDVHVIVEAKQGWIVPGQVQLEAYAPRLGAGSQATSAVSQTRLVTLSDSSPAWAAHVLPPEVSGVPVTHWSWDEIRNLIATARSAARGTERIWLDELETYMGAATSVRPASDSLAYCVVTSREQFGRATFRDWVARERIYFHPLAGNGWPTVLPNFLAFRWDNAVRQVNRVTSYEIVAHLSDLFGELGDQNPSGTRPPEDPHVVYQLGPDLPLPPDGVPSGPAGENLRAQRFWVLVDQLLTQPTVIAARDATKALGAS